MQVKLKGEIYVPGDKSISHRAIMFSSIAKGNTLIKDFLKAEDTMSTVKCFENMGVKILFEKEDVLVKGVGKYGLKAPSQILNVGNSGTTMRLISGILAGQKFESNLDGDNSIRKRPMKRIIDPLSQMGAVFEAQGGDFPPFKIKGRELQGITYDMPIASAQVKSAIILAGLYAKGETKIIETIKTRDHTERMLKSMGVDLKVDKNQIVVKNSDLYTADEILVPRDISSGAFFMVAASILKGSEIILKDMILNETRSGILEVMKNMGAKLEILDEKLVCNEKIGDVKVSYSKELHGCDISSDIIPSLIDEIPIIALLASQAEGITKIRGASELRVKESDRIKTTVSNLRLMGVDIEELDDGMIIKGKTNLKASSELKAGLDHRIGMMLSIASLLEGQNSKISGLDSIKTSFPNFFEILKIISA